MRDLDEIFAALARSRFRSRFHLRAAERAYLYSWGVGEILAHARQFIEQRLAPANPANDGRQTPMHGHPVFLAQHATATCCRSCLNKWHRIAMGHALSAEEVDHILAAIERWLRRECPDVPTTVPTLFTQ